jgi:hypothetical protein
MNRDGVSYLDLADAYARGDSANAVNASWGPAYSWVLAVESATVAHRRETADGTSEVPKPPRQPRQAPRMWQELEGRAFSEISCRRTTP